MSVPAEGPKVSREFFVKVNDFLAMAHRIARRYTIAHAQMAMLHAFARYSAHNYLSNAKEDSPQTREEFSRYIGAVVTDLVGQNIQGMAEAAAAGGAPAASPAAPAAPADAAGTE